MDPLSPSARSLIGEASGRFTDSHRCPGCGELAVAQVRDCDHAHLLCHSCRRCWRQTEHSYVTVDPLGCSGCSEQPKSECYAILSAAFPRFGGADGE